MATGTLPTKSQKREFVRWAKVLALHEAGLTVQELAAREDVTTTQIYALLNRARQARAKGWI